MLSPRQTSSELIRTKNTTRIKRSFIDRRSPSNRRETYSLDYFLSGGLERRKMWNERRQQKEERRQGWVRVSEWSSVYVGEYPD